MTQYPEWWHIRNGFGQFQVQTINGKPPHRLFLRLLEDYLKGHIGRREFLGFGTALGIAASSVLTIADNAESRQGDSL